MVTPLNLLGKQNVEMLKGVGMKAIFIGAETATPENSLVSNSSKSCNDIKQLEWQLSKILSINMQIL